MGTIDAMVRLRFSLRQLLFAVALVAGLLLVARYAVRNRGLAVGLLASGIAAAIVLAVSSLMHTFLRTLGQLFEPKVVESTKPPSPSPAQPPSQAPADSSRP